MMKASYCGLGTRQVYTFVRRQHVPALLSLQEETDLVQKESTVEEKIVVIIQKGN